MNTPGSPVPPGPPGPSPVPPAEAGTSRFLHPALAELPGHLLWRASARVATALAAAMPPTVDVHAYAVLLALADDVSRSQQELADTLSTSRTTMARTAAAAVDAGLVERVRNPRDRRSYALTRTSAGATALEDWERHVDAVDESLSAGFTVAERDDLLDLLRRVADDEIAPDAPTALRESLGFVITRLHLAVHRDFVVALEPLRLEPRLYGALTALGATGPIAQAELARLLGTSGASIVQMADALEARGLAERVRDAGDRRTQRLHLLPEAAPVAARAAGLARATMAARLEVLGEADVRRLLMLLRRFITAP